MYKYGTGVWARIVKSINSLNEKGTIPFSSLKRKVNDGTGEATDEWQWNVLNQNLFTVKHTRLHVDQLILPSEAPATRWCKSNPKKVNILVWRILRDRIPSRWNLSRKGVELSSLACPICSKHLETSHHLFWTCDLASAIWDLTFKWVDHYPNAMSSLKEVFSWLDNLNIRASRKLVLESIIGVKRSNRLEINQDCLVSEKWNGEWIWSWSRPIRGGTIGSHLEELQNLVSNVHLGEATDEWQWNVLNQNLFTVKHTRLHVDQLILPSEAPATRWCKSNPKKVNILVWRILRDRIPSRWNLSRKGVELSSLACPICSKHPETSHHLFWTCDLASAIWDLTFKWVDHYPNAMSSLTEVFSWLDNLNIRASRKLVLESIIGVFVWVI
ncbi:reverse transcriptase domain, Reverse transcriptase zinc-binding domain protein [Artemisia annua]|uniref:Reverse transcriptase domain, Reverse transcriptase zinc-binding domain protein n=1 Tax=Artemisia annua TaxID=35608 RepID=A0A2U1NVS0_ARTAN|nr:reverse transcriptase domain, Reverse transcriptase zinc-binding domain protein [Artemisia annua]